MGFSEFRNLALGAQKNEGNSAAWSTTCYSCRPWFLVIRHAARGTAATTQSVRPSVSRSVCLSVGPSVCQSVRPSVSLSSYKGCLGSHPKILPTWKQWLHDSLFHLVLNREGKQLAANIRRRSSLFLGQKDLVWYPWQPAPRQNT